MASYLPTKANLNHEIEMGSILQARTIAAATDERIFCAIDDVDEEYDEEGDREKGKWFWADSRAEALDLQSVNGVEVGAWDGEREPGVWRQVLGVVDGRREGVDAGLWRGDGDEDGEEGEEEVWEGEEDDEEEGNGDENGDEGVEGVEGVEGEEEEDDIMEIDPPEPTRAKVEVKVNVPVRM